MQWKVDIDPFMKLQANQKQMQKEEPNVSYMYKKQV